jgi:putative cell wall-binding protein
VLRRLAAAAVVVLAGLVPSIASADTLQPSQWPAEVAIGSAPNAVRFAGADRYQTSYAAALALRGAGGFPFDSPDRTSGGATSLAAADDWWGGATCPRAVIVTAGDTPADALAAAPLSDPTNRSDEPRLQRVAAADPFFDPIGGFDRVDTAFAPIIVTASARSGATSLSSPARAAVSDLARGGCATAREAIIVGGDAAVPVGVEGELVSLGYEEVFRVAGTDRFDTAARIATALGTEEAPAGTTCVDGDATDGATRMGFYGNAVIEFRQDATHCEVRGRTVVLADGATGADALAAGWWTSYWQVPVLLVAADGSLPPATRTALQTLDIDSLVILGGTGRIPEATVDQAKRLAGAVAGRFAGANRYETSVAMARSFGGWFPTGDGSDFDSDRVCIAAGASVGWPDALGAGPWCARLAATQQTAPARALAPGEDSSGVLDPGAPSHDAAPVLLVPAGASSPSAAVDDLLSSAFPTAEPWCRAALVPGCLAPGFAAVFGGVGVVSAAAMQQVSTRLGGDVSPPADSASLVGPFHTSLDLAPVFSGASIAGGGTDRFCVLRGGIGRARWIARYDEDLLAFEGAVDLLGGPTYERGDSLPTCVAAPPVGDAEVVLAISPSGWATAPTVLRSDVEHRVTMSAPMRHDGPIASSGEPGTETAVGTSAWQFRDAPAGPLDLHDRSITTAIGSAAADVSLSRGEPGTPATFLVQLTLVTGRGDQLTGVASGEALFVAGRWELAGRADVHGATGGFRATLDPNGTSSNDDDGFTWRFDGSYP